MAPPSTIPPEDLAQLAADATGARDTWAALQRTGGLLTVRGMAERWGVSVQTVRGHVAQPTFPEPVAHVDRADLWLAAVVDHWRATPRPLGRPKKPRTTSTD